MATIAVFVALGGTSYAVATGSIDSREIKNGTIRTKDISKKARNALKGQQGPPGPTGAIGPTGGTGPPGPAMGPAGGVLTGSYPNPGLAPPEPWHEVAAGSITLDLCADPAKTAVFCTIPDPPFSGDQWKNFGGSLATAAFYKDQLGIVHLKGVVSNTAIFSSASPVRHAIFRMPEGYRPQTSRIFPSVGAASYPSSVEQEAAGRLDVQPDGLVVREMDCAAASVDCSANGPYFTLDGISFRPDG
jgi:hypothetical protein